MGLAKEAMNICYCWQIKFCRRKQHIVFSVGSCNSMLLPLTTKHPLRKPPATFTSRYLSYLALLPNPKSQHIPRSPAARLSSAPPIPFSTAWPRQPATRVSNKMATPAPGGAAKAPCSVARAARARERWCGPQQASGRAHSKPQ